MASAIGCFQPGTFLWGRAHAEALSKVTADGKYLPSTPDSWRIALSSAPRFRLFSRRNSEYLVGMANARGSRGEMNLRPESSAPEKAAVNRRLRVCQKCGTEIPADAPEGGCPGCLLETALDAAGGQIVFGRYTLVKVLGEAEWELCGWRTTKNWSAMLR